MAGPEQPRQQGNPWLDGDGRRGEDYDRRFKTLAGEGHDVHGEARLVASLGVRSVLDAGCGTGRVAIELARQGLEVVGVDLDPSMLVAARAKAPSLVWVEADLATLDLGRTFDAVVMAGNVLVFVSPGTEGVVLARGANHLQTSGLLIAGFSLGRNDLDLAAYDRLALDARLVLSERWATWERTPFMPGGDYAVSVYRKTAG
jgi:SAM-dependent methyltransferase